MAPPTSSSWSPWRCEVSAPCEAAHTWIARATASEQTPLEGKHGRHRKAGTSACPRTSDRAHPRQATEASMRRFLVIAAAILVMPMSCASSFAQSSISLSAMGATSPLGVFGSGGSSGTGIPFAATEINPGGLSPAPNPNCSPRASNSAGNGMSASGTTTGAASSFDGGGLGGVGSAASMSSCSSPELTSSDGSASPLAAAGATLQFHLNGGAIPLGATELASGGVSPMPPAVGLAPPLTIPGTMTDAVSSPSAPNSTTTSCSAATTGIGGNDFRIEFWKPFNAGRHQRRAERARL